mgnify:CR=1 FL=1
MNLGNLNDFDINQHNIIVSATNCFMSYIDAYYRTINCTFIADNYIKFIYNPKDIYGGEANDSI